MRTRSVHFALARQGLTCLFSQNAKNRVLKVSACQPRRPEKHPEGADVDRK